MEITEEAYNNAVKEKNTANVQNNPYVLTIDDCINEGQRVHVMTEQSGDIGDLFTKEDIKHMNSYAADSLARRFGLKDEVMFVAEPLKRGVTS